jgi:O-antigen/teichoic acid export membrane protein
MTVTCTISGAILRFYIDYSGNERKEFIGSIILFLLPLAAVMLVCMSVPGNHLVNMLFPNTGLSYYPYYFYSIAALIFTIPYTVIYSLYRIKEKPFALFMIQIVMLVVNGAITVFYLAFMKEGLLGFVKAQLIGGIVLTVLYHVVLQKDVIYKIRWHLLKPVLVFSMPLIPFLFVSFFQGSADRYLLEKTISMAELAKYNISLMLAGSLSVVISGLASAYSPRMYHLIKEKGEELAKDDIRQMTKWVIVISFSLFVFVSLFSKEILKIFTTDAYAGAYIIIPILAFSIFIRGVYLLFQNVLYWTKKTGHVFIVNLYSFIGTIAALLVLIPKYGIMGAALSNVVGQSVASIGGYFHAQKYFKMKWNMMSHIPLVFVGLTIIYYFVYVYSGGVSPVGIGIRALGLAIYFLSLNLLGIVRVEHIKKIYFHVIQRNTARVSSVVEESL